METDIKVDVYPNQVFVGKINRIHPTISPLDRAFKVEIVVSNREGILRPGMFAEVNFDLDEEEAILLPGMAVLKMQGSNDRYLFVEKMAWHTEWRLLSENAMMIILKCFQMSYIPATRL